MAVSDLQFNEWLESSSAIPCTLVHVNVRVSNIDNTRYLSTKPYSTSTRDYEPIITADGISYTEKITLSGTASISIGDISLLNPNGELDSWLNDVWENREIVAYIGDIRWDFSDFRVMFNGLVSAIDSANRGTINLQIADKIQRLNTPVTDLKLMGETANKDSLIPVVFGEVHNISPLLSDPNIEGGEYIVSIGPVEQIIEARANGVPVSITKNESQGRFTLDYPLKGTLTCDVQGYKSGTYTSNASEVIKTIVKSFGKASTRFTDNDIDLVNFEEFAIQNPHPVGHFVNSKENVLNICQTILNGFNSQLVMSRLGKLRIFKLANRTTSTFTITESDIVQNSLSIVDITPVSSTVKLGYAKNWTVQSNLQSSPPPEHLALYGMEWVTVTKTDEAVRDLYKLDEEPEQIDTALIDENNAIGESQSRLDFFKQPHNIYRMTGFPALFKLELGQAVTLINRRFGLMEESPKIGTVISLSPNWGTLKIEVEVLI